MQEIIASFPSLSQEQLNQFSQLESLYKNWNEKINVVSRKDIDELYTRHVLHSLSIAKFINFIPGSDIMDVGTGGGFPGIPLAILFPEAQFYLIDSIAKKITVVNDIIEKLELKNCKAEQKRAEKVKKQFDFIISRAVTAFPRFHSWVKNSIKPDSHHSIKNGIIYLKGGDLSEEMQSFQGKYQSVNLSNIYKDPFFETKKIIYLPL